MCREELLRKTGNGVEDLGMSQTIHVEKVNEKEKGKRGCSIESMREADRVKTEDSIMDTRP